MTDAPKRIWAWAYRDIDTDETIDSGEWYLQDVGLDGDETEYHRADLSADLVRAALERAADFISTHVYSTNGGTTSMEPVAQKFRGMDRHHATISIAIRAIAKDDEAVEAIITSVLGEPT
jgi:hypothetical protein